MTDDLGQLSQAGFHRIHIISSVLNYRRRLATALIKLLPKPKFLAISPSEDGLPDRDYDWASADLLFVDLSEHKPQLRQWFFDLATSGQQLPPVIFLDKSATVDDAGDMVRAGAADYIDLTNMTTRRLSRAVLIAASRRQLPPEALEEAKAEANAQPKTAAEVDFLISDELATQIMPALKQPAPSHTGTYPKVEGMTDAPTEYLPPVGEDKSTDKASDESEEEADFLTTGLIDILDRIKLEKAASNHGKSATNADFLTTGLMSILERQKVTDQEKLPSKKAAKATEFAVGHHWPFTEEELEKRKASVGDYYIREFIAVGGTASVFKVHSKMGGKALAMKLFDSEIGDAQGKERFLRGYRLIAPIKHPNIVSIREINEDKGSAFVVMELIEGGDLKSLIEQGISRLQAVQYTVEIAQALDAAHEQGILHRDLKPSNILIREDGSLAVLDFGIAKLMAENQTSVTQAGHIVGTSHYVSPEQAVAGEMDGRSDLYSLGVILYEMLEGKRPYVGNSPVEIMQQHVRAPIPGLSSKKDPLNAVIGKLMAKKAEDRYPDGEAINKALVEAVPDLVENFC